MRAASLYGVAGVVSLLLSCWIALHQVIINPDAICYLLSANEIGQSGIHAAMNFCGQASWPFYSALIFLFAKFSFLSLTASAYILNAVFSLISVLSFIAIVQALGGNRRMLWLAAFVILCSYQFNSVREYIVRDHGFWAFYLLSMLFMLRFLRAGRSYQALGFGTSLMLASLFRIEGAVFLMALPYLAFLNEGNWRTRTLAFFKLNIAAICGVAMLGLWMLMHPHAVLLGRVPELLNQFLHGFTLAVERNHAARNALIQYVLPHEAAHDASAAWLAILLGLYLINIVSHLSWTALLVSYAWISGMNAKFSRPGKLVLWGYLLVNVAVTAMFFAERLFFSKRYLVAMSLVLLLWVPFVLNQLLFERIGLRQRYIAYLAMLLFGISSLGVVVSNGVSRQYIRDAGNWITANIPAEARLYSNDVQLEYYSQHFGRDIYTARRLHRAMESTLQDQLTQFDFAALRIRNEQDRQLAARMSDSRASIVKEFTNQHGDQVIIYKMSQQAAQ